MSEQNDDETQPTAPIVPDLRDADTPQQGAEGQGLSPRPGWKDRVYGVRSVVAVALAGLVIGGGAGAAIHAAADDGDRGPGRAGFPRGGPGGPMPGGGPGGQMPGGGPGGQMPGGPGGFPGGGPDGQVPPNGSTQPPDTDGGTES